MVTVTALLPYTSGRTIIGVTYIGLGSEYEVNGVSLGIIVTIACVLESGEMPEVRIFSEY
jgi:hypothetical protein